MQKMTKQTLVRFWAHATKYKVMLSVITIGVLLTTAFDLVRPFLYRNLVNSLTLPKEQAVELAYYYVVLIVVLGVFHNVIWRIVGLVNNRFQPRVISDLMNTCYEYLLRHSYHFFTNNFTGSIQTRVRKFAYAFESVADQIHFDLGRSVILILVMVPTMLVYFWQAGLMILCWVILYIGFSVMFAKFKLKHDIAQAEQDTKVTGHLADTLANHTNINLFAAHQRESSAFREITDQLFRLRKRSWNYGSVSEIFQGASMLTLELIVMLYVIQSWNLGKISIGDVVLVQSYLGRMFEHTWNLGRNIRKVYESLANANEMTEMLAVEHGVVDSPRAKPLIVEDGRISFQNVTFGYEDHTKVFSGFNLEINPGEKVALVGESGGGKSTILKMLLRFADVDSGRILIDGQDISFVTQDSLHQSVTLVPQDPLLFSRSLFQNIAYGKPGATLEEVTEAAKLAHCHEFISKFPFGYDTLVGERGVKLSGGERQRVAIARAILRNSPILVLDEATSSLDSESEKLIQDALHNLMFGKTVVVIAHRLSTIKEMDRIVVIENGKIVEEGSHEQLVKRLDGLYQRLWDIHVGGFAASAS